MKIKFKIDLIPAPAIKIATGLVVALFAIPQPAMAGGIMLYEYGTADIGLAAAGTAARAQDIGTIAANPAGMMRLKGNDFMLGSQLLYGNLKYSPGAGTTNTGGNGNIAVGLVPGLSAFYMRELSEDTRIGFASYSNFGLGLDYKDSWVGRYFSQQNWLAGLTLNGSIAHRLNDKWSVGGSLIAMYTFMQTKVAINTLGPTDGRLVWEDYEWGFGGNAGLMFEPSDATRFGLTYTSKINLDFKSRIGVTGSGPVIDTLNMAGLLNAKLGIKVNVPQTVMFSAFHQLNNDWAVMGNVGWQDWSKFGYLDITVGENMPGPLTVDGDFDDTWHFALGAQKRISQNMRASFGIAHDTAMQTDSNRGVVLPTGQANRFGVGLEYQKRPGMTMNFFLEAIFGGDLYATNSSTLGGTVEGTFKNTAIYVVGASFDWD